MIEIRTQTAFENIVNNTPTNQNIYIYPKRDGNPYFLSSVWYLKSNTSIVGVSKPKIQYTGDYPIPFTFPTYEGEFEEGEFEEEEDFYYIPNAVITALPPLDEEEETGRFFSSNIRIEGIHLIGDENLRINEEDEKYLNSMVVGIGLIDSGADFYYGNGDFEELEFANESGICVKDCIVENFQCGIGISYSWNSIISNNTIRNNSDWGMLAFNSRTMQICNNEIEYSKCGAYLSELDTSVIKNNRIVNTNSHGLIFERLYAIVFDNNTITNIGDNAIVSMDTSYVSFSNNNIINANKGISLEDGSTYNVVHNNSFKNTSDEELHSAIYIGNNTGEILQETFNNELCNSITNNQIENYQYGIYIQDSNKNAVVGNMTIRNDTGILLENSNGHIVYGNVSMLNTTTNYGDVGGTDNQMSTDYNK